MVFVSPSSLGNRNPAKAMQGAVMQGAVADGRNAVYPPKQSALFGERDACFLIASFFKTGPESGRFHRFETAQSIHRKRCRDAWQRAGRGPFDFLRAFCPSG